MDPRRSVTLRGARDVHAALLTFILSACSVGDGNAQRATPATDSVDGLTVRTLSDGFDTIWELAWGPDGAIWVTERKGTISRVDQATGATSRAGAISVSEAG